LNNLRKDIEDAERTFEEERPGRVLLRKDLEKHSKQSQESFRMAANQVENLKEDLTVMFEDLKQDRGTGLSQEVREMKEEFLRAVDDAGVAQLTAIHERMDTVTMEVNSLKETLASLVTVTKLIEGKMTGDITVSATSNPLQEKCAQLREENNSLRARASFLDAANNTLERRLEARKQKVSHFLQELAAILESKPPTSTTPNTAATSGEIEEATTAGAEAEAPLTPTRQIKRDQKAAAPAVSSNAQESAKAAVLSTIPEAPALPAEITANEPVDVSSSKSGAGPERGVS
jgi:chromosome segregation ATPase